MVSTGVRRRMMAVLCAGAAVLAVPTATAAPASPAAPTKTTECQHRIEQLGFGMTGTIELTLCPYNGDSWPEAIGRTTNLSAEWVGGFTRLTASNGTSYRGAWHYHGPNGHGAFNEGLDMPSPAPSGTQYCAQFFRQETRTSPVTEFSNPVCLNVR